MNHWCVKQILHLVRSKNLPLLYQFTFSQNRPKSDISGALGPILHYITLKAFAMAKGQTFYVNFFGNPPFQVSFLPIWIKIFKTKSLLDIFSSMIFWKLDKLKHTDINCEEAKVQQTLVNNLATTSLSLCKWSQQTSGTTIRGWPKIGWVYILYAGVFSCFSSVVSSGLIVWMASISKWRPASVKM